MTSAALLHLARSWGVRTSYQDVDRRRRHANPDALLAVLRELGAPVVAHADVSDALREHEDAGARPGIEPVHIAWDGALPPLRGRLPPHIAVQCRLELETGAVHEWSGRLHECSSGNDAPRWRTGLPPRVPFGYHTLELCVGSAAFATWIISAPRRAYRLPGPRAWGLFLPLYAVRSARGDGADYAALGALARWTGERGGSLFGTLPLLAAFLDEPFEPSPYAPASRLFWSDLYIDVDRLPGPPPDARLDAARRELAHCANAEVVDYRRIAALKRGVVDDAAQRFFRAPSPTHEPDSITRDYARFRAVCDRRRQGWHHWPDRLRNGDIREGDFDPRDERYHLYAAWVAERQLAEIAAWPQQRTAALYLDLPLGVHRDGFDAWRWPHLFATGASAGAPPDTFFPGGQDWGFAPVDPRTLRASGYRYFRDCLRHHARYAGALRLDHVMSLERLFWIPSGFAPDQGLYVQYPLEEMMAVLTLESVRHRTAIVGEDLGTVSRTIRTAMGRHGLYRMFVLQFEAAPGAESPPRGVPRFAVASLNTHDMPPFAAWRRGRRDGAEPVRAAQSGQSRAASATKRGRRYDAESVRGEASTGMRELGVAGCGETKTALGRALEGLAASRARCVIINLEDLWLETRPQNVPGSPSEQNWRHRARLTCDEIRSDPDIGGQLERVAAARQRSRTKP